MNLTPVYPVPCKEDRGSGNLQMPLEMLYTASYVRDSAW
jgi:hypothetical protein